MTFTDNLKLTGLSISNVELFSAVADQQYLYIMTKPSNEKSLKAYFLDTSSSKITVESLAVFSSEGLDPASAFSEVKDLSLIKCGMKTGSVIRCVLTGFETRYIEISVDYKKATTKVQSLFQYESYRNIEPSKVMFGVGNNYFVVVGKSQPSKTSPEFTTVLYYPIIAASESTLVYPSGGLKLPLGTKVALATTDDLLLTSIGQYRINKEITVTIKDVKPEVIEQSNGVILGPDGVEDWRGSLGNNPDLDGCGRPKKNNDQGGPRSGFSLSVVIWIIVALIVVLAAGFGWVAYRKHSVSKERYKRSEGKPRFDEDNGDESWDGSINGKLEKTGLKLE